MHIRLFTIAVYLQPLGDTDNTLFRFLRARKMDVTAAADMLASE